MSKYVVKFSKYFVDGTLAGIMVDCELSFSTLEAAVSYVNYCHSHAVEPVSAFLGTSNYTIHMSRIETIGA